MRRGLVVLLALSFAAGCSSSYEPVKSPRIVTVMDGGQPTFVKNGERVGNLAYGTGLADAVKGNARAEHHARVGHNLVIGGIVVSVAGLGTEIGGLVVLAKDSASSSPNQDSSLGLGLLITGAVVAIAGGVMVLAGQPHLYDAVNIYNDSLANDGLAGAPPPALTMTAAPLTPAPAPLTPAPAPQPPKATTPAPATPAPATPTTSSAPPTTAFPPLGPRVQ